MKIFLRFLFLLMFIIPGIKAYSQTFAITELDASKFPLVRAGFIALDASGNSYKNLTPTDFKVIENGKNMASSLTIECIDSIVEPCISVCLIVDKSGSMDSVLNKKTQERRWDWVKEGATTFLETLKFNNCTHASVVSFGRIAEVRTAWADSAAPLIRALDTILPAGGTDYNPPFLDPEKGAISHFIGQPAGNRRIIIFLTDGDPNVEVFTDSIIRELGTQNIQVYSITVGMPMNNDLAAISSATGGLSYAVYTKEDLNDIYRTIALDIQKKVFCFLNWEAPFGCDEESRKRDVEITFNKQTGPGNSYIKKYIAPPNSIAELTVSEPYIIFPDPPNNEKTITLTAKGTDFHINSITPTPPGFFEVVSGGAPPAFDIPNGTSTSVTLRYNPGPTKLYRQAQLVIDGTPCPPQIHLIAGLTNIKIIHPNGGEIFSTCDSVEIVWGGVDVTTPVTLSYSTDDGATWNIIKDNLTGNKYKWYPPVAGTRMRIRGVVSSTSSYMWAKQAGGTGNEAGLSLAVQDNNLNLFVAGYFQGSASFGSKKVTANSATDVNIFLAKYYTDGNLVDVLTAGGPGNDTAHAVCLGPDGSIFVTGVCYQGAEFGSISPNMSVTGVQYLFIAKYPPNFSSPSSVRIIGATDITRNFNIRGLKIRHNSSKVYVQAEYIGGYLQTPEYTFPKTTVPKRATIEINDDMSKPTVTVPGISYPDYSAARDVDSDGNIYETGKFTGNKSFGVFNLKSEGNTDIFVTRFGSTPGSSDTSDYRFSVESPKLEFTIKSYDVGSSIMGHQKLVNLGAILKNTGTIPITIIDKRFDGPAMADFNFDAQPQPDIAPGDSVFISLVFTPQDLGPRNAMLIITGTCAEPTILNLSGIGVCTAEVTPEINFGNVSINVNKQITTACAIKNINTVDNTQITINPIIENDVLNEFSIVNPGSRSLAPDSCLTLIVNFKPKTTGTRTAYINYQMPNGCENPKTLLTGVGLDTNLFVNEVNFNTRRVSSENDSFFVVTNKTEAIQEITKIELDNSSVTEFVLGSYPALPFFLDPGDTLQIPVKFIPSAEQPYINNVIITVKDFPSMLRGSAIGHGGLPKLFAEYKCNGPVLPGQQTTGKLEITNTSETFPLHVSTVAFANNNPEFSWVAGAPSNIRIEKQETKSFDVYFRPAMAGIGSELIKITADDVSGKEPVKYKITEVDVSCEVIGINLTDEFDMGNVLLCDEYSKDLIVTAKGHNTTIRLTGFSFDNSDSIAFDVEMPEDPILIPETDKPIKITFRPTEIKQYKTRLFLHNDQNIDTYVDLVGNGLVLNLYTDNREYLLRPGSDMWIPVKLDAPALSNTNITNIALEIKFDNKMLFYQHAETTDDQFKTFKSQLPGWTWNKPVQSAPGVISVSGSGTLSTPFNKEIFNIKMKTYLSDKKETDIMFQPLHEPCITNAKVTSKLQVGEVCFIGGRLVKFGDSNFGMSQPNPNPASGETKITFGVGLDVHTTIELYNPMGELVSTLVDSKMESGEYELTLPVDGLASGVYILNMKSGPHNSQQKLVITK